jgi:ketosteroid isomerase-like protein
MPLVRDTAAMSRDNVELIQRFYRQYFETGEPPLDMVDEDCELHDHDALDQSGVYRGHAGVGRWLDDWNAAWAEWSFDVEQFIDAEEYVVVFVRMRTKGLGSGVELDRQDGVVYRCRNDKIIRTDYYNSRDQALEAAGLKKLDAGG